MNMGLSKEDILVRVNDDIDKVSTVLSLSREAATTLLIRYNWNFDTLFDEWFGDEEKVVKNSDLQENPIIIDQSSTSVCGIRGGNYPLNDKEQNNSTRNCGHVYCKTRWKNLISKSINEGKGDRFCRGVIQSRIKSLISDENLKIYEQYLVATYASEARKGIPIIKWCPGLGCRRAVEFFPGPRAIYDATYKFCSSKCLEEEKEEEEEEAHSPFDCETIYDVTCDCSYKFCFKCLEEAHSPVDCETQIKWRSQSENQRWVCPDCNRPFKEKNILGCKPPCDDDVKFCDWDACKFSDIESKARKSLKKYEICCARVSAHENLRREALIKLKKLKITDLQKLSEIYNNHSGDDLEILVDAWVQSAECWRILKWARVYSYYLSEDEPKEFLEYTLDQAESLAERLLFLARLSLETVTKPDCQKVIPPEPDFQQLRPKLSDLTLVTRNYFDNLVGAVRIGKLTKLQRLDA